MGACGGIAWEGETRCGSDWRLLVLAPALALAAFGTGDVVTTGRWGSGRGFTNGVVVPMKLAISASECVRATIGAAHDASVSARRLVDGVGLAIDAGEQRSEAERPSSRRGSWAEQRPTSTQTAPTMEGVVPSWRGPTH